MPPRRPEEGGAPTRGAYAQGPWGRASAIPQATRGPAQDRGRCRVSPQTWVAGAAHRVALFRERWFDLGDRPEVAVEEPPLSDEELAYRAASGERAAFQRLHERHLPDLYDFAVRVVRARGPAGRAMKEGAAAARARLAAGPWPGSGKALFYVTLHHAALDAVLAGGGRFVEDPSLPLAPPGGDGRAVWSSAATLAPQDYALLDLHVRRGLGADELAAGLGVARGALARRPERLQQDLGDYAGLDPATAGRILADLGPGEPPGPRFSPRAPRLPERSKLPKRPNVRKPNVRKPSFRRLNVRRPNLRRPKGRSPLLVAVFVPPPPAA